MTSRLLCQIVSFAFAALVPATRTEAQVVEVPPFPVGAPELADPGVVGVVPASDGSMVFLLTTYDGHHGYAYTRHYAATGAALAQAVRVDQGGRVRRPAISPDRRGGFVLGYWDGVFPDSLWGRYLDAGGAGLGNEFEADCEDAEPVGPLPSFAGLPSGLIAVYETGALHGCLLDTLGLRRTSLDIGNDGFISDVAALPDGGFVVVWIDSFAAASKARLYDADGAPSGDAFVITPGAGVTGVAVNPLGGFAVAARLYDDSIRATDLEVQRFDAAGNALEDPIVLRPLEPGIFVEPDLAYDLGGDVYVAWGERRDDAIFEYHSPWGRVIDPSGTPLGPAFPITDAATFGVRTTRLANGQFVNLWTDIFRHTYADVISLCTPGVSVCGDGTVAPQCEQCDDGPANSDTTPDACRTDCRRPRCGDGVIDAGEACDDGNTASCDGCSKSCEVEAGTVCGDGVVAPPGCGETCDDSNAIAGDGCSIDCRLERIPGGGSRATDCFTEWSIDNPANTPFLDKHGAVNFAQQCVDDDPRCDFDGGAAGSCTFRLRVCANNTDLVGCDPPTRLASWEIVQPSAQKAAKSPALAVVRSALAPMVGALVGPSVRDLCSDVAAVTVPLRGSQDRRSPGKLTLKTRAQVYSGGTDKDVLKLVCLPAP